MCSWRYCKQSLTMGGEELDVGLMQKIGSVDNMEKSRERERRRERKKESEREREHFTNMKAERETP